MPLRARLLYSLQRTDTQLALRKRRYRQVEASLGESAALSKARAALKAAQEELARWRATLLDRELETESVSEKLMTDEERLYSGRVRNPRELSDLQKETEYLKRRKANLEDRQLEAMIAVEEATTRAAIANEEHVVAEAAWEAKNAQLSAEYDTLRRELTRLLAQRKSVVKHIGGDDMAEYTAIRQLRKGTAVVAVNDGMCRACNVQVPRRELERAQQTDELFHCSGCDRILYVPEDG